MTETDHVSLLRQGKAAWSAWREANPSIHPDLREANLNGAKLRGGDLSRATLIGAKLNGANLSLADLSGANLSDADLEGADLSGANLNRTNLRLANLSIAQLTGVQWRLRASRGCYVGIRGLGIRGMALFRAWGLIDYGRSLLRVAAISFGLAAIIARRS
jgi:uncharacterized protein YjbI with pentapeptide repeats